MESNFRFLIPAYPILTHPGILAERYIHDDPNTYLFKLRLLGENRIEMIFEIHQPDFPKNKSLPAKAFRGELVEQLPTDSDARDLPEQIKLAKEGLEKGGKGRKMKVVEDEVRMVAEPKRRYGKRNLAI